jgi:hypothetical protein
MYQDNSMIDIRLVACFLMNHYNAEGVWSLQTTNQFRKANEYPGTNS